MGCNNWRSENYNDTWRSNAWTMVELHKGGIFSEKNLCELIDDFVPLRPVNFESRWTKLVLKMAHREVYQENYPLVPGPNHLFETIVDIRPQQFTMYRIIFRFQYIRTRGRTGLWVLEYSKINMTRP